VCQGEVLPAIQELCNGIDDNCNGVVDENPELTVCGPGVCGNATKTCVAGVEVACVRTSIPGYSATEVCGDGLDNDCDGNVDNGCACTAGSMTSCWGGSQTACPTDGGTCIGVCARGTQTCTAGGMGYGACTGGNTGSANETCNDGLDNNCNGQTDCAEGSCTGAPCSTDGGLLSCFGNTCRCVVNGGITLVQASETACSDGFDNDCNGKTDCAESACGGKACGTFGKICSGTSCVCSVDGGVVEPVEHTCTDGKDNDCNGLTDCGEGYCAGKVCGPNAGLICTGGVCSCNGNGGVAQLTESSCTDGFDNDCDGRKDCLDTNCTGASCGANGLSCATDGGCACAGGTVETLCSDNLDNDCDGKKDCTDTDCAGRSCGANGLTCSGVACTCSGNGGVAQATETSCNDGFDNDCDGLKDCLDPNCAAASNCVVGAETNCFDGVDNDGDGKTDCADTDCLHKSCAAVAGSICCSTAANATACKNMTNDKLNCGVCGVACNSGTCTPSSGSGHTSGVCTCSPGTCPSWPGSPQTCGGTSCSCGDDNDRCGASGGTGAKCSVNICYY
jgi:hypothetical protein